MKIAVASDNGMVTKHFGHCSSFEVFDCQDGKVIEKNSVVNPGHKKGFLPGFLAEKGIDVIISGGMGQGAIDLFSDNDIEVIIGASGDVEEIVLAYLAGKVESTGSVCQGHH